MSEQKINIKKSQSKSTLRVIIKPLLVFLLVCILIIFIWHIFGTKFSSLQANEKGDAYGSLNTLFSGLAFAGVIVAIGMQAMELREQREELELTRREFEELSSTAELQRFENSFYSLVNGFESLKERLVDQRKQAHGTRVFSTLLHDKNYQGNHSTYVELISNMYKKISAKAEGPDRLSLFTNELSGMLNKGSHNMSSGIPCFYTVTRQYMNYFQLIITYIFQKYPASLHKNDEFKERDVYRHKLHYINVLCAHLSQDELEIVLLHCLNNPILAALVYHFCVLEGFASNIFADEALCEFHDLWRSYPTADLQGT